MMEKSLLAVFAHPDDESFRAGGTLALLAKQGLRVQVLTATHGEAGSCGQPPLCSLDELPAVREQELFCACHALGLEPPIVLNYQDGHLSSANPEEIIENIVEVIKSIHPQAMLTFGPDGLSGHPDHIAIGRFALSAYWQCKIISALYVLAVPQSTADELQMTQIQAVPDETITHTVDVMEAWQAKLSAIRCHQTQIHQSPIVQADQEKQQKFLGQEHFRLIKTRSNNNHNSRNETDILRGVIQ
jgi:N-acetylglucosamine malate deacetylase 2